jgi:Arc/MetJ family transcription regulator
MPQYESVHTRFEVETWDQIESYRRAQRAIPSKSAAVCDLVKRALAELQAEPEKRERAALRRTEAA